MKFETMLKIAPFMGPLILILFACIFFAWGTQSLDGRRVDGWPSTEGTVLASSVSNYSIDSDTFYEAKISYRYSVAGKEYQGNTIDLSVTTASSRRVNAQEVVDAHPPGQVVTVFYDPQSPSSAALNRFNTTGSYITLGVGGFLLLCSIFLFFKYKREDPLLENRE